MYHPADGSWCRKYSDGWLEQGGVISKISQSPIVVTLLKAFTDEKYVVTFGAFTELKSWGPQYNKMPIIYNSSKNSTSFSFNNTGEGRTGWTWYACGKGV